MEAVPPVKQCSCPLFSPNQNALARSSVDIDQEHGADALEVLEVQIQPPQIEAVRAQAQVHLPPAHRQNPNRNCEVDNAALVGVPGFDNEVGGLRGGCRQIGGVARFPNPLGAVDLDQRLLIFESRKRGIKLLDGTAAGYAARLDVLRDKVDSGSRNRAHPQHSQGNDNERDLQPGFDGHVSVRSLLDWTESEGRFPPAGGFLLAPGILVCTAQLGGGLILGQRGRTLAPDVSDLAQLEVNSTANPSGGLQRERQA